MATSIALCASDDTNPVGSPMRHYHRFPLVSCPLLPKGLPYCLVSNDGPMPRIAATGRTRHDHGTLNLAAVRHAGAVLNAWEVWIFAPTGLDRRW